MRPESPPDQPPRPTIYDVAGRAGVSKSLVSLVLRNAEGVSERRRAAVLAAIDELGYRPSLAASELAGRRTRTIEMIIDDVRNLSFVGLLDGLRAEVAPLGYHVTITDARPTPTPSRGALRQRQVDGLVLAAEHGDWAEPLPAAPMVVAGARSTVPPGADLVASDDHGGGVLATDHLIQLGHRTIGHLTGSSGPARHRRDGYVTAVRRAGLQARIAGDGGGTTEEDGYAATLALLDVHPALTAVLAANDPMALGALAALRERGRAVPQDVSLVGYDDSPLARSRYLRLTSVDDRSTEVGGRAARALLARIDDPNRPPQTVLVEPTLVVRGTTGPRRAPVTPARRARP